MVAWLWSIAAHAFVGAIVAPPGVTVAHQHATAVVYRSDVDRGVLTLTTEVDGGATRFAWIVPVVGSAAPTPREVDAALLTELDTWTAPQVVEVTCEDLFPFVEPPRGETGADLPATGPRSRGHGPWGCYSEPKQPYQYGYYGYYYGRPRDTGGIPATSPRPVRSSLAPANYVGTTWTFTEVTGAALRDAVADAGFVLSDALAASLATRIDDNATFVIAEAALAEPADGRWVEPFRLDYASARSPLLVREGAAASEGEQDLLIFTYQHNRLAGSAVNYRAMSPETDCLVDADGDLTAFYDDELAQAFAALPATAGGAGWLREYEAFGATNESGEALSGDVIDAFSDRRRVANFVLTRARVRYDPKTVETNPEFVVSEGFITTRIRYVAHNDALESNIATCNDPFPDDPGSCFDEPAERQTPRRRGLIVGLGALASTLAAWRALRRT
jgi:hypothetical protein